MRPVGRGSACQGLSGKIGMAFMSDSAFHLQERLAADTMEIAAWPLCLISLMLDRRYPWLILVLQRPKLKDLHDLAPTDHGLFMNEVSRARQCGTVTPHSCHRPFHHRPSMAQSGRCYIAGRALRAIETPRYHWRACRGF
jgi:hypothetical protein